MECVLRFISEGKLDVEKLITHRFPLSQIDDAVAAHVEHPETTLGTVLLMAHEEDTNGHSDA
jgi:threonine dehydrogenase-like Zn-dependent dehydrogenase